MIAIVLPWNTSGTPSPFCNHHHHHYTVFRMTLKFFIFIYIFLSKKTLFRTRIRQSLSKHLLLCLINKNCSGKTIGSFSRETRIQMTKTNLPTLIITISSRHESKNHLKLLHFLLFMSLFTSSWLQNETLIWTWILLIDPKVPKFL